jgi:hypothetical protein
MPQKEEWPPIGDGHSRDSSGTVNAFGDVVEFSLRHRTAPPRHPRWI